MNDLIYWGKILQGLCHTDRCSDIKGCPKFHGACRKRLDLETSCYWEAADRIAVAREFSYPIYNNDTRKRHLNESIDALHVILTILYPHFGPGKTGYDTILAAYDFIKSTYDSIPL